MPGAFSFQTRFPAVHRHRRRMKMVSAAARQGPTVTGVDAGGWASSGATSPETSFTGCRMPPSPMAPSREARDLESRLFARGWAETCTDVLPSRWLRQEAPIGSLRRPRRQFLEQGAFDL